MKKLIFSILFLICFQTTAYSCINEIHINSKKIATSFEGESFIILMPFDAAFFKQEIDSILGSYDLNNLNKYTLEEQSDIGVQYLKIGEFEKALEIFERIIKVEPRRYEFNSNLGTTYELLGKNELALKYIQKGLEINPSSHKGTEDIHVSILKAKLAIAENPDWINHNTILDLEAIYQAEIDSYKEMPKNLHFQAVLGNVGYQLRTRIPFVPKSDLTTCLLFKEIAEFSAEKLSVSYAHGYALIANYYAPTKQLKTETAKLVEEFRTATINSHSKKFDYARIQPIDFHLQLGAFHEGKNGVNWYNNNITDDIFCNETAPGYLSGCFNLDKNDQQYLDIRVPIKTKPNKHDHGEGIPALEKSNRFKIGWLIAFIGIVIVGFFLWRTVIRNSKELDNFE